MSMHIQAELVRSVLVDLKGGALSIIGKHSAFSALRKLTNREAGEILSKYSDTSRNLKRVQQSPTWLTE